MAKNKYDVEYFVAKFEAIPEDKWATGILFNQIDGTKCVLGHCGVVDYEDKILNEKVKSLVEILDPVYKLTNNHKRHPYGKSYATVYKFNDLNEGDVGALGETPKERILNALSLAAAIAQEGV